MTQVALHVSRISEAPSFLGPSAQQSFLTAGGYEDAFPSFMASRPASACVYGRKITEAAVLVKDRDEMRFPMPVFYPKKVQREPRPKREAPSRKTIQSASKKAASKPRPASSQGKARTKTPTSLSANPSQLKRLNTKKATEESFFKKPHVPSIPPHPRPASTISSKSADKITASEMMRYLADVPQILEKPSDAIVPTDPQPLVDEIVKESLRKQRELRDQRKREQAHASKEKQRKKEELDRNNRKIRETNKTRFRVKKTNVELPWGADQRRILGIVEQQYQKEAQIIREKRRTERAKSAGRSRLGLEILDILGAAPAKASPQKRSTSDDTSRNYSHYDSREIQLYMREQQVHIREEQEMEALRMQAEEEKRLSQLEDLEHLQRAKLAQYKRTKKRKDIKKKSKKKKDGKKKKEGGREESVLPEDSEVSQIMDHAQESSSNLMEREGRSCKLFGNMEVSEELGNGTKLVSSIVDKHGTEEHPTLPKAMNTAPMAEVLDSSRAGSKPSSRFLEGMNGDSFPSLEYEDRGSEPGDRRGVEEEDDDDEDEDVDDIPFDDLSDNEHSEILRRKDEVRKRLAELRIRMEDITDINEDSAVRERPQAAVSVVKPQELKRIVQDEAATKIQAHIRRFLVQRRVGRILQEMEEEMQGEYEGEEEEENEEQEVANLLNQRNPLSRIIEPKTRPTPIDLPPYEEDSEGLEPSESQPGGAASERIQRDVRRLEAESESEESEGMRMMEAEMEERLRAEHEDYQREKEKEIEVLKEENKKLLEDQKKQTTAKSEEEYMQMLNTAKEQEMHQFQELMQTKCGSRVDLVEEMSMAFESMLDARYRQLAFLFSQNRERIQAALRSAPSDLDISSTFTHTNAPSKPEEPRLSEGTKTPELPLQEDSGLDTLLNKVIGVHESKEIERQVFEHHSEIAKQALQQVEDEDPPFDPYSARPENPFPDEDSESSSSIHSFTENPHGFQSPNLSEIQKIGEEEENKSPMKKMTRQTDSFTKPLQLQLVTSEGQDSSSRSLSRSGKHRYFKEDWEEKELPHVPSPDPASILRPHPIEAPFRMPQSDLRGGEEPSKPAVPFQVSAHLLKDIDSSGSFQDDMEDSSSLDDLPPRGKRDLGVGLEAKPRGVAEKEEKPIPEDRKLVEKLGKVAEESMKMGEDKQRSDKQKAEEIPIFKEKPKIEEKAKSEKPKIDEKDKNLLFEAISRPFLDRVIAESIRLSGAKLSPVPVLLQPLSPPHISPPSTIKQSQNIDLSLQRDTISGRKEPIDGVRAHIDPSEVLLQVDLPPIAEAEVTEIRLFDPPPKPLPSKPIPKEEETISESQSHDRLIDDITNELMKRLLKESVPRPAEKSMPELPPLNFKQLEGRDGKPASLRSKTEVPEKISAGEIKKYLEGVFEKAEGEGLARALGTAIEFDPVDVLGQLQEIEQGPLITYDIQSKALIPAEVYLLLDDNPEGNSSRRDMTPSTKDIIRDSKRFHNRLLFDAANEALQKHRPYGLKGSPLPWSTNVRSLAPSMPELMSIRLKVMDEVVEWSTFEVGKIPDGEIMLSSGQVDEEQLQMVREEKLSKMLTQEILDNDNIWVDYEAEEAQVKIDIADMILEQIMVEIEDFLQGLEAK